MIGIVINQVPETAMKKTSYLPEGDRSTTAAAEIEDEVADALSAPSDERSVTG